MYSITVSHHLMVAHTLRGSVFGPAQGLHGATFVVEAEFRSAALDADGIVCDIGRALDLLKAAVADLEYRNLDDIGEFRGQNTTTEFLAGEIHRRLAVRISQGALGPGAIASLRVVLRETPVAWAASAMGPLSVPTRSGPCGRSSAMWTASPSPSATQAVTDE